MKRTFGAVGLMVGCATFALPAYAQPALPRDAVQLQELLNRKPPPVPHEEHPGRWPQPDYFLEALKLTEHRAPERAARPRVRGSAPFVVLPVQVQAFGFTAAFRALLGAELDLLLDERGVEATRQTDAADAHGPFVRSFDEPALAALLDGAPQRRLVMLHSGHDGVDRMFLTLVLRDRAGVRVGHESLALPDDPAAALQAAATVMPRLLSAVGIDGKAAGTAAEPPVPCRAEHWQLGAVPMSRSVRQQACQALLAGVLLPDFGGEWPSPSVSTPARLAWLARAYVHASRLGVDDATGRAIREMAAPPLGLAPAIPAPVPTVTGDPVLSRLRRLLNLQLVDQTPVQSTREARARQVEEIARGLPPFAAALVGYRAELLDIFGAIELCEIERLLPGAMPRAHCRRPGEAPPSAPARAATEFEALAFQEWRIASNYRELYRLGGALGRREAADALAAALPSDVAAHPFMQRQLLRYADHSASAASFDTELAKARRAAERVLANLVAVQRGDDWSRRSSLSEGRISPNLNIVNDARIRMLADDDLRLLSVLKYDRFGPEGSQPERRAAGERAFFLVPERGMVRAAQAQAEMARVRRQAPPVAPSASTVVRAYRRQPFGDGLRQIARGSEAELAAQVAANPGEMQTRVVLAFERLKRGLPLPEAIALINERPDNRRSDERISESHAWAGPAHAFLFAGEPDAARGFYEKVLRIGTGSDSDLHAGSRVPLIAGRLSEALDATQRRLRRYESDFARRDAAGLLFMRRQPDAAWALLLPRLAASQVVQLWHGVYVGHRIEGADLKRIDAWFAARQLEKVQIDHSDADRHYQHLLAVVDRIPGDAEIARLKQKGSSPYTGTQPRLAASAQLVRAALTGTQQAEARDAVLAVVADDNGSRNRFLLPQFAWIAWQVTNGREPLLAEVRAADLDADFHGLLAKSLLLAQEGQVDDSLQYLRAARYELAQVGLGSHLLQTSPVPVAYQWALAGHLMYRKTGRDDYRQEVLRFVRAYQRVQPYFGWLYALEALLEKDLGLQQVAACRARFLDANSYFLAEAKVAGLDDARCRPHLW